MVIVFNLLDLGLFDISVINMNGNERVLETFYLPDKSLLGESYKTHVKNFLPQEAGGENKKGGVNLFAVAGNLANLLKMIIASPGAFSYEDDSHISLQEAWKFIVIMPWLVPLKKIRDYYGEKIALYFNFLSFFTKKLFFMSIFSIPVYIVQLTALDEGGLIEYSNWRFKGPAVAFSFTVVVWSSLVCGQWKTEEAKFSRQFGQLGEDDTEVIRTGF